MTKLHEKSVLINGVACTDLAIDPSSVAITNGRANFGVRPNFVHGLDALSLLEELAAIQVANRVRNVVCVDTFSAAAAGGGYAAAVAKGWFGANPDGVHRSSDGRFAFEAMFSAIVSGNPWTHSAVLG